MFWKMVCMFWKHFTHSRVGQDLDHGKFSACEGGKFSYARLLDGNRSFEVCTAKGDACATYDWTVDTVKPTASVTVATSFTNASRVPVNPVVVWVV